MEQTLAPANPTLIDIARETNTSVSTVSRVLAGGAVAQRISRETRGKVVAAAQRMGYRPNLLARSLRTRKTNTIALLVSDIANPFFASIASRIEQSLHRHGYSLLLCNSGEDAGREAEYLHILPSKGVDGLIVVPFAANRRTLQDNFRTDLPLVILDREVPGLPMQVVSDQQQGAQALCDSLARHNVRKIALVCGPEQVVTHRRRATIVAERFTVVFRYEGLAQAETGRQAFIKLLDAHPKNIDAVVCTNSFLAQGFIDAIESIDSPPVIGCFDEIPMMHLLPLPIVCAIQDIPGLAEGCVRMLMKQLGAKKTDGDAEKPEPVVLPMRVVSNRAFQPRGDR
jgi:LacI family transcriptional regulator